MRGPSVLLLSVLLLSVVQAQNTPSSSVKHQIIELERQGWEAAKNRGSAVARQLLTDDALDIGEYGIWDANKSAQAIASLARHPDSTLS